MEENYHKKKSQQTEKYKQSFFDSYFFYPNFLHKILAFLLLPFSFLYYIITTFRKNIGTKQDFRIKILSIGNLVSGGSGKTPFCIALVKYLESLNYGDIFIILRGYKRHSKGLQEVSLKGKILCGVKESGDEAMLIAKCVKSSVLVCEKREKAIEYAKTLGAKIIILDDGYRFRFHKFDILLEPIILPYFPFVLPSGYYRFLPSAYKNCDLHLKEERDYIRKTHIHFYTQSFQTTESYNTDIMDNTTNDPLKNNSLNVQNPMQNSYEFQERNNKTMPAYDGVCFVLVSAIANPMRLQKYLPKEVVAMYFLPDHAEFDYQDLKNLLQKHNATHILMTQKDFVKCEHFDLAFALLELEIEIKDSILQEILYFLDSKNTL
ncbi:tetraacyldisaccharide 4'-kinase [Helicobacter didelphidarum]|uniref:Tetraacyldisaccharide 4'-kinase n=1 Tax=Helicobacter didelphidarum TaxID=2040648 RepID=A0A3D8IMR4_9HELI|nr:tetraacyldisaccharide 4'-kinase [Helicobacter didelphidarum]RDU66235.1 tetraacyldisaccharide 4'-kinase [Helicobacter didelphidarum]